MDHRDFEVSSFDLALDADEFVRVPGLQHLPRTRTVVGSRDKPTLTDFGVVTRRHHDMLDAHLPKKTAALRR